jgi:hypothetical protein
MVYLNHWFKPGSKVSAITISLSVVLPVARVPLQVCEIVWQPGGLLHLVDPLQRLGHDRVLEPGRSHWLSPRSLCGHSLPSPAPPMTLILWGSHGEQFTVTVNSLQFQLTVTVTALPVEAGATFDNSFFDNSFIFLRQFKNRSFLDTVFVHVTGRSQN